MYKIKPPLIFFTLIVLFYQSYAQPPLPSGYFGSITINGNPAPVGTEISAWINGVNYPSNFVTTAEGQYGIMSINGDDPSTADVIEGGVQNEVVNFKATIGQDIYDVNETGIWESGVNHQLNLTAMVIGIKYTNKSIPERYQLEQNYPNPFNNSTIIKFQVLKREYVSLSIYNNDGQLVKLLISGQFDAGLYHKIWDGSNETGIPVSSGIYYYQLQTPNFIDVKKCLLIK